MDAIRARGRGRGSSRGSSGSAGRNSLLGTIHGDLFTKPATLDKKGTSGTQEDCLVNFVPIEAAQDFVIYQYHLNFVPMVDSKSLRQKILLHPNVTNEIGEYFVFDGMILYMRNEWENTQSIEVPHPITKENLAVEFKLTSRFQLNDAQTINCFNVVIRRCFDEIGLTQLGRHYFDPEGGKHVNAYNMDVLPGYETAIRMYEDQLMLCVENRFKMMRTDTMLHLIKKEYDNCGRNMERLMAKINEMYSGVTIVTLYNNKLHRFTRVDFSLSPASEFMKDGEMTTLAAYFENQYGKKVTDMDQPVIISEGKPKQPGEAPQVQYLLPEFCNPTGLTEEMRKDMRMMRTIASHTRLNPEQRREATERLLEKLHSNSRVVDHLAAWQINLGAGLAQVGARVLPPEILTGANNRTMSGQQAEWSKSVRNAGTFEVKNMQNWIVVSPAAGNYADLATKFIAETTQIGQNLGMSIGQPLCQVVEGADTTHYMKAIRTALEKTEGYEVHMMVVLLIDDNKTRYDTVKKFLCTQHAVPSQCVNLRTLCGRPETGGQNKNFGSIVLKIVLQIVCKMGGSLWKVNIPMKKAMLVGYDLYHDSTLRGKTVGACVSTVDQDYTKFYSQTRPHENPTQLGNNLSHFIRAALRQYYDHNDNTLPERIILYRDGAGDGQIPYIKNTEVKLVQEACDYVLQHVGCAEQKITLAFIIVTKRVNMRIFKQCGNRVGNPNPGTVVDSVVTRPERYDFYMVPQYVNQGTVTPVSYNIIFDDTGLKPDQHHKLAFKLCHLYYNWQGTVRVPALCQYAHKIAFLTAQSTHDGAHKALRDKLFFL